MYMMEAAQSVPEKNCKKSLAQPHLSQILLSDEVKLRIDIYNPCLTAGYVMYTV